MSPNLCLINPNTSYYGTSIILKISLTTHGRHFGRSHITSLYTTALDWPVVLRIMTQPFLAMALALVASLHDQNPLVIVTVLF